LRILLADDNAVNVEVALAALERFDARADVVVNGREAVEATARTTYDLILMDGSMPDLDGFEATRIIRARDGADGKPRVPIIAMTAHVIGHDADAWRAAGMDAVLHKPFAVEALGDLIEQLTGPAPLIEKPRPEAGMPAPMLPVDAPALARPSTDLPDLAPEKIAEFAEMARLGRRDFARTVLNLWRDNLPRVLDALNAANDADDIDGIGRAAHSLKSMSLNVGAARVAQASRDIEHAARLEHRAPHPHELVELQAAVEAAKTAIARELGEASSEPKPQTAASTSPLRIALANSEIVPFYQPIVDRTGQHMVGVEALARWVDRDGAPRPVSQMIADAERDGTISDLGRAILQQATRDVMAWPGLTVSVNVSPVQLVKPDFVDGVEAVLRETGLPPARLILEITESALLEQDAHVVERLKHLRGHGIGLALDDFGTGYASLAYLRRFPFDRVKIDRMFVHGVDSERDNATIVQAITATGRAMGLKVVAEGVESEAEEKFLASVGVHFLQGFRFGRPMPAADITTRWQREHDTRAVMLR
jgi:EAL domain-containing protein (putative c-di-GMP-specific phosphodiesterase class I)/HPt (histidine-containing phosphotransfer) domain-containing protein